MAASAAYGCYEISKLMPVSYAKAPLAMPKPFVIPSRDEQLKSLKAGKEYDVLIIGGGATGCGIAVDAVTRGLSTAMVERDDFASGTSSRSTKLIHGGVRYLGESFLNLDYGQYELVKEALHERATLIKIAPHVATLCRLCFQFTLIGKFHTFMLEAKRMIF